MADVETAWYTYTQFLFPYKHPRAPTTPLRLTIANRSTDL